MQEYGSQFERRLEAITVATKQARAFAEASPDDEAAMGEALVRLAQQRVFTTLIEAQEINDPRDLARFAVSVARLTRAGLNQKRWTEELRHRLDQQRTAASEELSAIAHADGLSPEIRAVLLAIDPLPAVPA